MKKLILFFIATILSFSAGVIKAEAPPAVTVPPEVMDKQFLYELSRHLYRWYLDEIDLESIQESIQDSKDIVFKIRLLDVKLDDGDKSQYAEIIYPAFKLAVKLKKADYRIDELNVNVKSKSFKINNVARYGKDFEIPPGCVSVSLDLKEMKDYLFKTRYQGEFPSPVLYERIKKAFRKEFSNELLKRNTAEKFRGERITFISPLSPVANEIWAFLEHGKLLVRCASDIDLNNPEAWEHESLSFKVYDVYNQMVVSLDETAADNSFMTRDQIGRALYNCVVLGQRIIVPAAEAEKDKPTPVKKR
jgi:hypothetical protein